MSDNSQETACSIGLFGGSLELTRDDMRLLDALRHTDNWNVLLKILREMDNAMTFALRDKDAGIEDLRYYQGVSACAGRIADIVEQDVPEWYATQDAEADSEEEAEGNSEGS